LGFACGVGKGKDNNTRKAAVQAAENCRANLGSAIPNVLILFISSLYDQETALSEIRKVFPDIPLVGCSSAGEIYTHGPDEQSIALLGLADVTASVAKGGDMNKDAFGAGEELGEALKNDKGELVLMLSDGLSGDGAAVIRGMQSKLPQPLTLIGGAAGDDAAFQSTDLYFNDEVLSGTVIGVRLHGDIVHGVGVHHGWEPVGLPVTATKSKGNRLIEINGIPAIKLYDEYFGEYTERLRNEPLARLAVYYPLGLAVPESEEYLLRAPLSVENDGTIRLTAEVPEGTHVRLMIGSVDSALEAARCAAKEAVAQMNGRPPKLAMLINGVARRRLLGLKANEEIQIIREIIGESVPVIGFYSYGEVAPLNSSKVKDSCFHNETIVILLLG
jgi:hypothetical protein